MSEKPTPKTAFLYTRILLWVTLPLFLLGAFFTATQLTQQINILNEINRVRSENAFKSIDGLLRPLFRSPETLTNVTKLSLLFSRLKERYGLSQMDAYNVLENSPLIQDDLNRWTRGDSQSLEEILPARQQNKSYITKIDKDARQLAAYFFLTGPEENDLFIVRAFFPLSDIRTAMMSSRKILLAILVMIIFVGLLISQGIARSILHPLRILDRATREIMHGHLGQHIKINTGDEIEALANTFNRMSDTLEEMKRQAQDANPLTGLPGNIGIFRNLEKRILNRQKFVLFHCDLDRFKVFNDQFGLAAGDRAIKATAELLKKAVKERGDSGDFVGHQGGDDFVVILKQQHAAAVAEYICENFKSSVVRAIYPKEDYENGHTMQLDRRRQNETGETVMVPFPLITISLAGISNAKHDFADYSDVMARVAPVKKEAKKKNESNYIIQE